MKFQGALIKEGKVKFAVVIVKNTINNKPKSNTLINELSKYFGLPTVLMEQNTKGVPEYYGRKDLSIFLSKVPLKSIPWKEYSI